MRETTRKSKGNQENTNGTRERMREGRKKEEKINKTTASQCINRVVAFASSISTSTQVTKDFFISFLSFNTPFTG
jgi:FixJ family two-component response regulator